MAENKDTKQKHIVEETARGNGVGGKIEMSEDVVAAIAGLAARDVEGIHSLGKSRLISFGESPSRGVDAEVGNKQAALDLEVIIEHGCDIRSIAEDLRRRIAQQVHTMAGREVVEVNLDVVGIHMPESDSKRSSQEPRVV